MKVAILGAIKNLEGGLSGDMCPLSDNNNVCRAWPEDCDASSSAVHRAQCARLVTSIGVRVQRLAAPLMSIAPPYQTAMLYLKS